MIIVVTTHLDHIDERIADCLGLPGDEAFADAVMLVSDLSSGFVDLVERGAADNDAIILVGKDVREQWRLASMRPLQELKRNGGRGPTIVALPRPHRINQWWRDPEHVASARDTLRRVWGSHTMPPA